MNALTQCRWIVVTASLGGGLAAACGGSGSASNDAGGTEAGNDIDSGGSSGSNGANSGTGANSGSMSNSGSNNGMTDDGGKTINDCPNCMGSEVCCLADVGGQVQGTCAANAAECPNGAGVIGCAAEMDCNAGQTCCVTGGSGNGPASATCASTCPTGRPGCGGSSRDNVDCPGGGAGWNCQALPGTPSAVLGICVPLEGGAPEGGAHEGGASEGGAAEGGGDAAAPSDGAVQDSPTGG